MATKRKLLEEELAKLMAEQDQALAPVRKKLHTEEESIRATFKSQIETLQQQVQLQLQAEKEAQKRWLIIAKGNGFTCTDDRRYRSVYNTQEEAIKNKPADSGTWSYVIIQIKGDQSKADNTLKDDPPSR